VKNQLSHGLYLLAILCVSFLTAGCPVGLKYPLAEPFTEPIDKNLLGTWVAKSDSAEMLQFRVILKSDYTYVIDVQETSDNYLLDIYEFDAWVTKFEGRNFIYGKAQTGDSEDYYLYEYVVKDKNLAIQDVSLLVGGVDAVTSTEALRKEIAASLKLPDCLTARLEYSKR
jgi:hypothetical protein